MNSLLPTVIILFLSFIFFGYKFKKGRIDKLRFFYLMVFACYIASLVSLTLFPFPYQKELIEIMIKEDLGMKHNFIPFKTFLDTMNFGTITFLKQMGGNILLFVPLGFILPILFLIKKRNIVFLGFLISFTVELTQSLLDFMVGYNYRSFDVDDLITNTLGVVFGLLLFNLLSRFLRKLDLLLH